MEMINEAIKIATLRTIDKYDKVGAEGVKSLLTNGLLDKSGAFINGVGLHEVQANAIVNVMQCKGKTNRETLDNLHIMADAMNSINKIVENDMVMSRIELFNHFDDVGILDHFCNMPSNKDETWSNGARPYNIGWALDDLIKKYPNILDMSYDDIMNIL